MLWALIGSFTSQLLPRQHHERELAELLPPALDPPATIA